MNTKELYTFKIIQKTKTANWELHIHTSWKVLFQMTRVIVIVTRLRYMPLNSCSTTRHEGACVERGYSSYSFSTSALDGVSGQRHARPGFTSGERNPGTHWTGGWVGLRASLDTEARGKIVSPLPGIEPRSPGCPARIQTLYWLSYPGSRYMPLVLKMATPQQRSWCVL
jgi:hypothetical protein